MIGMQLGSLLVRNARQRPNHTGVVFRDRRLSWAAFNAEVNRLANGLLAAGFRKGERIATVLPNCLELVTAYWAAAKTGTVVVPISPLLSADALASLFANAGPAAVFADPPHAAAVREAAGPQMRLYAVGGKADGFADYAELLAGASDDEPPAADIQGDDPFNIVYSSGTTGEPKGIVHTHFIRSMYAAQFASSWRMTPESVTLHSGALIFNGAFVTVMPSFYLGGTFVFLEAFEAARVIATIAAEKVTHTMLVPSQIAAILNSPDYSPEKLASLEMLLSLGAPLHLEYKDRIARELPGRFYELYGVTEGFITVLDREDFVRKEGSVGAPMQFNELRVVGAAGEDLPAREIGEIVGRGPLTTPGYYGRPDLTAEAIPGGWVHTGDLGYLDEDGFLYLVDRKKDMIISGGVNVYPHDIEEVIVRHPAVAEVAVFGVDDAKWGETPIAAVVVGGAEAPTAEELKAWINQRIGARFQRVREVWLLEEFPKNAAGKVLKRTLREVYEADGR